MIIIGQYHYIVNLDKREFLHPHAFGDGLKLLEFGPSADGIMLGLAVLLAASNGRGGGDLRHDHENERHELLAQHIVGRWAGDRIAIIGDYWEAEDLPAQKIEDGRLSPTEPGETPALPSMTELGDMPWAENEHWIDVSALAIEAMEMDPYVHEDRHEVHEYPNGGGTYTRADRFGANEAKSELSPEGEIFRIEDEIED